MKLVVKVLKGIGLFLAFIAMGVILGALRGL